MKNQGIWSQAVAVVVLAVIASCPATAQYPSKPITLIVFTPPGGPADTAARTLAPRITSSIGQPVLVENRPGAEGLIAAQAVMNAAPDGYTLLWASGSIAGIPMIRKSAPFKSLSDFAPVSIPIRFSYGLYVHPSLPANTVAEFVNHAKAHPGKLSYATGPLAEFMAAALFIQATGVDMVRVPYKGGAQAMPDVVAGRVQVYFTPMSIGHGPAQSGKLRMLATLLPERSPLMPNVPTIVEAGVDMALPSWNGIFAPPNTPREITERLSREVRAAVGDAQVRAAFDQRGVQPVGSTPSELAATIVKDEELWRRFIRDNKIEEQ